MKRNECSGDRVPEGKIPFKIFRSLWYLAVAQAVSALVALRSKAAFFWLLWLSVMHGCRAICYVPIKEVLCLRLQIAHHRIWPV
jgi:hypothetical protein